MQDWLDVWVDKVDNSWTPDSWQRKVLKYEGNVVIRNGRQTGKSVTIARKAGKFAIEHDGTTTLVIAAAQRQSSLLFEKILAHLEVVNTHLVDIARKKYLEEWDNAKTRGDKVKKFELKYGIYEDWPTLTRVRLKNGSKIYSLPAGKSGVFIRGFTVDLLIGDEAAYISEQVWVAVKPMIAVSKQTRGLGWEFYLSTPFGKGGYFYDCCHDDDFLHVHVTSEQCRRIPRDFLRKEKLRMSKVEYAQEYLGEFVDEFNQFFPTALIKKRMTFIEWNYSIDYRPSKRYYLGVDVARYGADENAFVIAEMSDDIIKIVYCNTTERKSLTDTAGRVASLDEKYRFSRIFVDDQGIGAGVTDILIERFGRRVIGLNNSRRTVDSSKEKFKSIFKEDLYSNASVLMEREPPQIEIISDLKLLKSLKSMTFEYTADKNLKIFGKYSHLSEAFVRACWCTRSKGLKLFVY